MKVILLFIIFSLLCPSSLAYAMPCEEAWTPKQLKKLSINIRAKIRFKMSLEGFNLKQRNLQGRDLSNMNLASARLQYASLRDTDLTNAYFVEANLYMADLRGAKLEGTNFYQANLYGAKVTKEQAEYLSSQGLSGFVVVEETSIQNNSIFSGQVHL